MKNLARNDFKNSAIIVVEANGNYYVRMPEDSNVEFSTQACKTIGNALMAVNEPSFILSFFLWLEKKLLNFNLFLKKTIKSLTSIN